MSGSLGEVLAESERRTNRSCTQAALAVAAVFVLVCLVGLTEALGISYPWMYFYAGVIILPILAVAAYAKARDYRSPATKYLMIGVASLVPAGLAVPTLFGFFLMPLPIVVAGRYFSRRLVWLAYLSTLLLTFVMTVPHAHFGMPSYPLCEEARTGLQQFLDGQFSCERYWRYLTVYCFPSFAVCLSFFAITMGRLCRDHLDMLELQAKTNARLADVEKGLAIAATMQVMGGQNLAGAEPEPTSRNQPDVRGWSTQAILDCVARVKRRAAEDSAFAALVERDPAAAVKEIQT